METMLVGVAIAMATPTSLVTGWRAHEPFDSMQNTEPETRCIAKQWLLMGHEIRKGTQQRPKHVRGVTRDSIPVVDEETLDIMAASLGS